MPDTDTDGVCRCGFVKRKDTYTYNQKQYSACFWKHYIVKKFGNILFLAENKTLLYFQHNYKDHHFIKIK